MSIDQRIRDGLRATNEELPTPELDRALMTVTAGARPTQRRTLLVGVAAAAAVVAVVVGVLAVTGDSRNAQPPTGPVTTPTPTRSQGPGTWVDTAVVASDGYGWRVPDPLKPARDAWFPIVTEHLGPRTARLESDVDGVHFELPAAGSSYDTDVPGESKHVTLGRIGLMVAGGEVDPLDDGCAYLRAVHEGAPAEQQSCSTERFTAPTGEPARISSWGRRCTTWEGGGPAPATCGDYAVAVGVERRDGLVGYVVVTGRGTPAFNPLPDEALAAAAADPRLTLPDTAYDVPSDQTVVSVLSRHLPQFAKDNEQGLPSTQRPGSVHATGKLGRLGLSVQVLPAGDAPTCGDGWLLHCLERRVFGADDPTTVFVGAWDEKDWADCCPRNSRIASRTFVYVGPRHTVVVSEHMVVRADEEPISAELDQLMIDLVLDPRLQAAGDTGR